VKILLIFFYDFHGRFLHLNIIGNERIIVNKKLFIWGLVAFFALSPVPIIVKYLQTFIVRNAIVTTYLYEVHAPIDGVVERVDIQPGQVPDELSVLTIENIRIPRNDLDNLNAHLAEKQKQYAFLMQELAILEKRLDKSKSIFRNYRNLLRKDWEQSLIILKTQQMENEAKLAEATKNRSRNISLAKSSVVTQAQMDRIEADYQIAKSRVNATLFEMQQVEYRVEMLQKDLFLSSLADGILQEQNRVNSLQMKTLEYRRRIQETESDIKEVRIQLSSLQRDLENRAKASINIPAGSLIWNVEIAPGLEVIKGETLFSYVDRTKLMVEVAIDDATLALILPDQEVRIRLFGERRFMQGRVISVRGSASRQSGKMLAATIKESSGRDGQVLVQINDPALYKDVERFCGIGRAAYAEFEGVGLMDLYFGAFFR
jgi:multidrug resistance efflux pump